MSLEGWQRLKCDCGGEDFIPLHVISYHPAQGTANKVDGWQCGKCGTKAAMGILVEKAKKANIRKKLEELNDQL